MSTLNLATEAVKVPRTMNPETIYVAPLSLVEVTVADARVSHLVTLINGDTPFRRRLGSAPTGISSSP